MTERPDVSRRAPNARRNRRQRTGNAFAFLALMCGIASWVPLIVVITGPLTLGFFVIAHLGAWRRGEPHRIHAAWTGLVLALLSFALQGGLALVAAIPGVLSAGCNAG